MSSTNRGADRALDDHYATHPELAKLICQRLNHDLDPQPVNVLEPGCGEGSFLDAIAEVWPEADRIGYEINPDLARVARSRGHTVHEADILDPPNPLPDWSLIIGNPPFKHADEFIKTLLPNLDPTHGYLAFVLRLNYLGGQSRYANLWSEIQPHHVYVMPARPGFTPDGRTDSIEYMVAVFRRDGDPYKTTFSWLDNRDTQRKWDPDAHVDLGVWSPGRGGKGTREEAMRDTTEWGDN